MPVAIRNPLLMMEEQRAYELRVGARLTWAEIAERLGLTGESVARAYANRHIQREGLPPLTAPNPRRQAAAQVALQARFGRSAVQRILNPQIPQTALRTFGVEIEYVGGIPQATVARKLEQALGVAHIHNFAYHGKQCLTCRETVTDAYKQWKVEQDGSVHGEVVSPILQGQAGFDQIKIVMKAMKEIGCKVNKQCGLHVHLGMKDLNRDQRILFIKQWYANQAVIKRFVDKYRQRNQYCQDQSPQQVDRMVQYIRQGVEPDRNQVLRTASLNITPFGKIGTYEVRLHGGTLNPKKINTWIKFLMAFVEFSVVLGEQPIPNETQDELNFLDYLTKEIPNKPNMFKEQDAQYMKQRALQLAGRR